MKKLTILLFVGLFSLSSCMLTYESGVYCQGPATPTCPQQTCQSGGYTTGYVYQTSTSGRSTPRYQNNNGGQQRQVHYGPRRK